MVKAKTITRGVLNLIVVAFGLALYVFGWTAFLTPLQVTGGGVVGVASIVFFAKSVPIGATTFVLNALLILAAWKVLGPRFCLNTLVCTILLAVFFSVGQSVFPYALVKDDPFMSVIIGSVITAVGAGIAINAGGNTGGTDIIALIIGKFRNISYGRVNLYANFLIVGSSYFIVHDVYKLVYSFVVLFVYMIVSDLVIDDYRQNYQFMIFSVRSRELAERINRELHRGATLLKGYGSYTRADQDVLLIIVHRTDKVRLTRIIKDTDRDAFITVTKTAGVYGKNFDNLKL